MFDKTKYIYIFTKIPQMTAKAVLCRFLLEGRVLNVRNCAREIGYTNCAREIPRMVEEPFGLIVSRTPRTGKNRYGQEVVWTDYHLNNTEYNAPGIIKAWEYVNANWGDNPPKKPVGRPKDGDDPVVLNKVQTLF